MRDAPAQPTLLIRLAPGTYKTDGRDFTQNLVHKVSIEGAGAMETVIEGTVRGLRSGAVLSRLTVAAGFEGGVSLFAEETPEMRDCIIKGNLVGGVIFEERSSPVLTNCVIVGNGVCCEGHSSPTLINCTSFRNSAENGGGVYLVSQSRPTLTNCIVWKNAGGSIAFERQSSARQVTYSCVEGDSVWPGVGNSNADPSFENEGIFDFGRFVFVEIDGVSYAFPDFIVETPDYHPRPDSPCIDAGSPDGAPEVDLEGNERPCGAGVDIGAFESGDCFPVRLQFLRGDCDGDGRVGGNTTDSIVLLRFAFLAGDDSPCLAACDAESNGTIGVADAVRILRYSFLAQAPPDPPFPECGASELPSDVALGCESAPAGCD